MDLELYSTAEIMEELKKRFPHYYFIGMRPGEDRGNDVYHKWCNGSRVILAGLLHYASHTNMDIFAKSHKPYKSEQL